MTLPTTSCSFSENLAQIAAKRTNITKSQSLTFYVVSPPLVPEKPFDLEVAKRGGYYNFPPTGSLYLSASIDSLGLKEIQCKIIDLNNLLLKYANEREDFDYNMWRNPLKNLDIESSQLVFLVSYMFGTTKECYVNLARYIRRKYPDCLIITGGVQATFDKDEILDSGLADIACLNEGELQLRYIAESLYMSLDINNDNNHILSFSEDSIPGGIYLLNDDLTQISTGETSQPVDFDWNLSNYYEQIGIDNYYKYGGLGPFSKLIESYTGRKLPYSAILTKRGCRAHCAFCTVRSFNGKGLRFRDLDSVMNELRYLYQKGIRHIEWLDDDLLFNESFNLNLFESIKNEFPDLIHTASNGLIGVAITPKLMKAMAESGLIAFKIGVESGNSQVIKDIRKPTTLWKLLEKAKLIREYGHIFFSANFIVGFPGETFSQMMDSFTFARKLSCDWASFYVCQPLKGTDLYSSFQHLMDPRALKESYSKLINPGKTAARGEFAYTENEDQSNNLLAGWSIFDLDYDLTFEVEAHNEIWFTFNLVANFLDNPCYKTKEGAEKLRHWLYAIHSGYPFDASMTAALAHIYYLLADNKNHIKYKLMTESMILESNYWQMRVKSFPELMTLSHFDKSNKVSKLLRIPPPKTLIPEKYQEIFDTLKARRDEKNWKD